MILRTTDLKRYRLVARDGPVGDVEDVLFDDDTWRARYLVVKTGNRLPGPGVLIAPVAVSEADWTRREIKVDLTLGEVKNSPRLESQQPVSRQYEVELHGHYRWPPYWTALSGVAPPPEQPVGRGEKRRGDGNGGDPNLRSAAEVEGYRVEGTDGQVGRIEDVAIDLEHWRIPWFVVGTRRWLLPKEVPVPVAEVDRISWAEQRTYVGLPAKTIKKTSEVVV